MKTIVKKTVLVTGGTGAPGTVVAGRFVHAIAPSIIKTDADLRAMGKRDSSKWVTLFVCSDKAQSINGA